MAHREQRDTPVGDSVLAIVGAFTNGLDVFKRLRERRRRRKSTKKAHRPTPAQLEPSGDELQLSNSLRQNPVDIQRHYETNYAAVGEKFAQGDAIAHASLTEVLLKLNSGLVAIIGAFLTPGKNDHHPDYKSLTSLSDTSRAEAVDALGQLYQRLSQSQLVLDRIRHKCPSCGSHQHHDCGSSTNLRQRGGCGNAKRLPGAKPKPRRSQTELVIVRRPRNSAKYPPLKNSSSTALSSKSQRQNNNSSSGSSASTPVNSFFPTDLPPRPQLPRSQSTSTCRSDPPPSYSKATATSEPPSREKSLTRKPVKLPVKPPAAAPSTAKPRPPSITTAPTTAKTQPPAIMSAPPLQRPGTWPHGPRPLRETTNLPVIPPQQHHQPAPLVIPQRQAHQPAPLAIPQRQAHQQLADAAVAPLFYQPARPPKFPVSTAALAELPGSSNTPPPPPPPPSQPNVLRRQPPLPPPKKQHLQALPPRPLPTNPAQRQQPPQPQPQPQPQTRTSTSANRNPSSASSSANLNLNLLHPSAQLSRHGMLNVPTASPSTYSFSSDSTKLGEIPMRKWTVPWDYAAMERANEEAAAAGRGGLPAVGDMPVVDGGNRRRGGLLRFLRRGE